MLLTKEDLIEIADVGKNIIKEFTAMFGPEFALPDDVPYNLVEKVAHQSEKSSLYLACGMEDIIHQMNADFAIFCQGFPFDFTYEEWPDMHDWDFWNPALKKFLKSFLSLAINNN
jgi:hypothetical protein